MKKSVDILGLPVISITEGRELGMSKTLLIDAPNRVVECRRRYCPRPWR